jgi:SAM-dependent methyltransferase
MRPLPLAPMSSPAPETANILPPRSGPLRASLELFAISFLILFLELACIRWFGSTVTYLTFFTNIVLMACFLGVSVGCLASASRWSWINALVPLAILAIGSACGFWWAYDSFNNLMIDVGSQQSPQLIYFGTDGRLKDPSKWVVPIEWLAAYFFVLIALLFLGPGQEMGRRFSAIDNRMLAYSVDILGSLSGITAFGLMSYFGVGATFWFLLALAIGVLFVPRWRWLHGLGVVIVIGLVALADWPWDRARMPNEVVWSPYYQVRFNPRVLWIDVNNIGHQGMLRVEQRGPAYYLPYLLNRDAGGKSFDDVLVVGAGSGNDVAAALAFDARHVDAVEIDPVIYDMGRRKHPNRPFFDPRVSIHLEDGRSFIRNTPSSYDLINYALVDSLALHSSYTSVRLESFLFTEQAFRDVKAKLKPGGVFAMYNFYRQGWVVGRLIRLAEKVFGSPPIVLSMPYQDVITPSNNQRGYITFLLVGDGSADLVAKIRSKFERKGFFWLNSEPRQNLKVNGFGPAPPFASGGRRGEFSKVGPAKVEMTARDYIPTDDWPFLYLREPGIPALNLRGMAIVALLSLAILLVLAPVRRVRPNGRMFFLGAGFMLLETKGVVHMALLFGATWVVNSIVFFSILTMILASNLYVVCARPRRLWPFYVLLVIALLVNTLIPMDDFLSLPGTSKVIGSCLVVYLPVFFAGVIFATAFRSSSQPDVDFGSNIAGIILGGLSEYGSLILGFNHLLWIAIGYYVLSALLGKAAVSRREAMEFAQGT